MAANPARFDLRSMSALQKELHAPITVRDEHTNQTHETIATPFASLFQSTLRNSSLHVNLTRVANNESSTDYVLNQNIDYLLHTYLYQDVPPVAVHPRHAGNVEIAWTHYLGINLFRTAELRYGDVQINTLTPMAMYFWMLHIIDAKRLQAVLTQIGHTSELTGWATSIGAAKLQVHLPWFYASHTSMAFPFFLLRDKKEVVHQFNFVKINKLLRMRVRANETADWKEIPFDPSYLDGSLEPDGTLPIPEVFGRAVMLEEVERNTMRCQPEITYYYDTFRFLESKPETPEGQEGTIQLDCEAPCKAFTFGCISMHSKKTNQHQNWLAPDGENPAKSFRIVYGNNDRVPATDLDHLEMDMWALLPPNFVSAGLSTYLNDIDPKSFLACSGVVYSPELKAELCLQLRDTHDTPASYKLQVLLWTTRKLVFRKDDKDELVYNLSVHPDPITEQLGSPNAR